MVPLAFPPEQNIVSMIQPARNGPGIFVARALFAFLPCKCRRELPEAGVQIRAFPFRRPYLIGGWKVRAYDLGLRVLGHSSLESSALALRH